MAKDLFSRQTVSYARYRPTYPAELYEYILGHVRVKDSVWDCGTGNGQAAFVLADHFKKVKATDISEKQLAMAPLRENIDYIACTAELTPFSNDTFDLVTVAQAYHWFNFQAFENEARRVSKPGGIIAIWGYNLITTHNDKIDAVIYQFYHEIIGPYWDAERKFVEENYNTIPFPFSLISSRNFSIDNEWSKSDLIGYLNSWSAVQHFIAAKNFNPVDKFTGELAGYWPDDAMQPISFPVFVKLGQVK